MVKKVPKIVKEAYNELPHFEDGRINYTRASRIPVVAVFIKNEDNILVLKRSDRVGTHRKRWCVVVGYFDELKSAVEKSLEEVQEETGIREDLISSAEMKGVYKFRIEKEEITYISHLILAEIKEKPEIDLNWEHTDYKWINIKEVEDYLSEHATRELKMVLSN